MPLTRLSVAALVSLALTVAPGAHANAYHVVHSFAGGADGQNPAAALRQDSDGNLYGTTYAGGANGVGTVFKIAPDGSETVISSFGGKNSSQHPESRVTIGHGKERLYGTASAGGAKGWGTIWRLQPGGLEVVLHSFNPKTDGSGPFGNLLRHVGDLYGITPSDGPDGYGTLFKLGADGTFTVLHAFGADGDGAGPSDGPIRDQDGNLDGTTEIGGAHGYGTIYEVAPDGAETLLYSFADKHDGAFPAGGLAHDAAGNLYGTSQGPGPYGSVFRLAPDGTMNLLHTFAGGDDGSAPRGAVLNIDGAIYGTTSSGGGGCNCGTVFKIAPDGKETILHSFAGPPNDGNFPTVGLTKGKHHTLYGTTYAGGANDLGTAFSVSE